MVLGGTFAVLVVRAERARLDERLAAQAAIYAAYARDLAPTTSILEGIADSVVRRFPTEDGTTVRIFAANGALLSSDSSLGQFPSRAAEQLITGAAPILALAPETRRYVARPIGRADQPIGIVEVSSDRRAEQQTRRDLLPPLLPASLLALAGAAALAWLLARSLLRPLHALRRVAGAIAGGDLAARSVDRSSDEIGQLATQVNQMADDLNLRFEQIERLAETRRQFYRSVSHELRTPLTAIRGIAENLEESVAPADRRGLEIIQSETERLGRLVDELLADGERGAASMRQYLPVDLGALADDVVALMHDRAERAGVRLHVDRQREGLVLGDRDRLRQALINLVDNALKWTPAGGDVRIKLGSAALEEKPAVLLVISDTGRSISSEARATIWERGNRGADGGQGLGLALVREIISAHGGVARLADTDQTTIELLLPRLLTGKHHADVQSR